MTNSTHTVIVKQQNRGLAFLIGIVTVCLLLRWWITGSLANAITFGATGSVAPVEGVGSVTGVFLPLLVDVLIMVGAVVISIGSGVWSVLWDVIAGFWETFRDARDTHTATQSAVHQATSEASTQATVQASSTTVQSASKASVTEQIRVALKTLAERLKAVESKLDAVHEKVFPPPPPEPTVAELQKQFEELQQSLKAKGL